MVFLFARLDIFRPRDTPVANGLFSEKNACYIFIVEREFAEISWPSYYIIHIRFV